MFFHLKLGVPKLLPWVISSEEFPSGSLNAVVAGVMSVVTPSKLTFVAPSI